MAYCILPTADRSDEAADPGGRPILMIADETAGHSTTALEHARAKPDECGCLCVCTFRRNLTFSPNPRDGGCYRANHSTSLLSDSSSLPFPSFSPLCSTHPLSSVPKCPFNEGVITESSGHTPSLPYPPEMSSLPMHGCLRAYAPHQLLLPARYLPPCLTLAWSTSIVASTLGSSTCEPCWVSSGSTI